MICVVLRLRPTWEVLVEEFNRRGGRTEAMWQTMRHNIGLMSKILLKKVCDKETDDLDQELQDLVEIYEGFHDC